MKFTTDVKKQHTVPRFLLHNFGFGKNKKKRLFTYDKANNRIFQQSVFDATTRNSFYNLEKHPENISLEPILSKIEENVAPVIQKIIQENSIKNLSDEDKHHIAVFTVIQNGRSLNSLKLMEDIVFKLAEKVKNSGGNPIDIQQLDGYDDVAQQKDNFIKGILQYIEFAPSLLNKTWILYETNEENPFYISDNPVTKHNDNHSLLYGKLGLESQGIQIYLPLSSTLTLSFICPSIFEEMLKEKSKFLMMNPLKLYKNINFKEDNNLKILFRFLHDYEYKNTHYLQTENVIFLNSLQVAYAVQYIFSKKNDFSLAKDMLSNPINENLRTEGMRMTIL